MKLPKVELRTEASPGGAPEMTEIAEVITGLVGLQLLAQAAQCHVRGQPIEKLGLVDVISEFGLVPACQFRRSFDRVQPGVSPSVVLVADADERRQARTQLAAVFHVAICYLEHVWHYSDRNDSVEDVGRRSTRAGGQARELSALWLVAG